MSSGCGVLGPQWDIYVTPSEAQGTSQNRRWKEWIESEVGEQSYETVFWIRPRIHRLAEAVACLSVIRHGGGAHEVPSLTGELWVVNRRWGGVSLFQLGSH